MGLIFSAKGSISNILAGAKTQTRRPVTDRDALIHLSQEQDNANRTEARSFVIRNNRKLWQVGRTYAIVPKRGAPAIVWARHREYPTVTMWKPDDGEPAPLGHEFYGWKSGRIQITAIRQEPVNAITDTDARAEGFAGREEYLNVWRDLYGKNADLNALCWVIEFKLVDIFGVGKA